MSDSSRDRLIAERNSAKSPDELCAALARVEWYNAYTGAECPANRIPSWSKLAEWWDCDDNTDLEAEVRECLRCVLGDGFSWYPETERFGTVFLPRHVLGDYGKPIGAQAVWWSIASQEMVVVSVMEVHQIWLEKCQADNRPRRHPLAPVIDAWQRRAADTFRTASVTSTRGGYMTRRPAIVSTVRRTAWVPDVHVHSAVVDGEAVAALRADPANLFPNVCQRQRRKYRPGEQRAMLFRDGYGVSQDLRLISLQEVTADPDASHVLANDVLTMLNYAHVVDRPMVLTEHDGTALLARNKDGGPRPVKQDEYRRFWEAAAWLRVLMVWDPVSGYRWVPLAYVDVPRISPVDCVTIGRPEWARDRSRGKWTLTGEGSAAAKSRVTAGRWGMAGRIITGVEYRLAASWDGNRQDRRSPFLRPAYGKTGPGRVHEMSWRVTLRGAGYWWDETDDSADNAALSRFNRLVDRLGAGTGEQSFFVPGGEVRKTAPAGDSVEIVERVRGHRGRPAGLLVRASARFVEAARLAQIQDGEGFEYRMLTDWAGLNCCETSPERP